MKQVVFSFFWFFCCTFVFFAGPKSEAVRKKDIPFYWSAEKNGKKTHLLGTFYVGISLEEDVKCSEKISEQIKGSDLIFLETKPEPQNLTEEEKLIIYIGPREEREKVLDKLSKEEQEQIERRRKMAKRMVRATLPHHYKYEYEGRGNFRDFNGRAKEFFISYGANVTQWSYTDYFYFIFETAFFEAFLSSGIYMNEEIYNIAQTNNTRVQFLDDSLKVDSDLNEATEVSIIKWEVKIDRRYIENYADRYNQIVHAFEKDFSDGADIYKSGKEVVFKRFSGELSPEKTLERNTLWLKPFIAAHQNPEYSNIFLAAEAKHFLGPFNLIDLLRMEGFSLKRISCP